MWCVMPMITAIRYGFANILAHGVPMAHSDSTLLVVPKSSFPTWLSDLPGGNDRWRLDKEEIELMKDNDGSTDIYRVTRRLLGIPDGFIDKNGNRMEWDDSAIGQRSWDDL